MSVVEFENMAILSLTLFSDFSSCRQVFEVFLVLVGGLEANVVSSDSERLNLRGTMGATTAVGVIFEIL